MLGGRSLIMINVALAMLLLFVISAITNISAYLVSNYRPYFLSSVGFIVFGLSEVASINVLVSQALQDTPTRTLLWLGLRSPALIALQLIGTLLVWSATCSAMGWKNKTVIVLPLGVWLIAILIDYSAALGARAFGLLYGLCNGGLYLCLCVMTVLRYSSGKFEFHTLITSRLNLALFLVSILVSCMGSFFCLAFVASDSFPSATQEAIASWMSGPLPICFDAGIALRESVVGLKLRHERPPRVDNDAKAYSMDRVIALFASRNGLTQRETEVLRLLIMDETNTNIAQQLFITTSTVKVHVHNILKKTGYGSRTELAKAFWSTS